MTLYFIADVETTGENFNRPIRTERKNQILQIAYMLFDSNLNDTIHEQNFYVKLDDVNQTVSEMNDYVKNMHTVTGLITTLQEPSRCTNISDIDAAIVSILEKHPDERIILVGNNPQFDYEAIRRYLPQTCSKLHYAFLDVSSIRRMFDIIGSDFGTKTKAQKPSNHDAQIDNIGCLQELKAYLNIIQAGLNVIKN